MVHLQEYTPRNWKADNGIHDQILLLVPTLHLFNLFMYIHFFLILQNLSTNSFQIFFLNFHQHFYSWTRRR